MLSSLSIVYRRACSPALAPIVSGSLGLKSLTSEKITVGFSSISNGGRRPSNVTVTGERDDALDKVKVTRGLSIVLHSSPFITLPGGSSSFNSSKTSSSSSSTSSTSSRTSIDSTSSISSSDYSSSESDDDNEENRKAREEARRLAARIWTVPNILSMGRIAAAPVIGGLVLHQHHEAAFYLFLVSGITDFLDGYIAKNYNQASTLGTILDPIGDKMLVAILSGVLGWTGVLPIPFVALMLSRDAALLAGAAYWRAVTTPPPLTFSRYFSVSTAPSFDIQPHFISKVNTVLQIGTIASALAVSALDLPSTFIEPAAWLTAATTIASGLSYAFNPAMRSITRDTLKAGAERRQVRKARRAAKKRAAKPSS